MGEFYGSTKHQSPTRRLIAQKKSTFEHKEVMARDGTRTQRYGIHYTQKPGVSYVVEPVHGEINYEAARRNPLKFYDSIDKQDVMKHKLRNVAGKQVTINSQLTKRFVDKILSKVEKKLTDVLKQRSNVKESDLYAALQDPKVKTAVRKSITKGEIQLVDPKSDKPLFSSKMWAMAADGLADTETTPGVGFGFKGDPADDYNSFGIYDTLEVNNHLSSTTAGDTPESDTFGK